MRDYHAHRYVSVVATVCIALFLILAVPFTVHAVSSGWLIDPYRYHVSDHSQFSCQECHPKIANEKHPVPGNVNKSLDEVFSSADCEQCHDKVFADLEESRHGSRTGIDPDHYTECSRCHSVHYVVSKENRQKIDSGRSLTGQCSACHENQSQLPPPDTKDVGCYGCHLQKAEEAQAVTPALEKFCFACHGLETGRAIREGGKAQVGIIDEKLYGETSHADLSCMVCHPESARYPHAPQHDGNCLRCHVPHDEKVAATYHGDVACEACHLRGVKPVRERDRFLIGAEIASVDPAVNIHDMRVRDRDALCNRCHASGNVIGAPAMVLPAKSIICMPCHASTFSAGDTTTIVALIVFLFGVIGAFSFWLSGTVGVSAGESIWVRAGRMIGSVFRAVFSARFWSILEALVLDGLLLRRLFNENVGRWSIHALIYYPFVFRFFFGIVALLASLWFPGAETTRAMLDKNDPATAFLFDLSGACIILGIILAVIRGLSSKKPKVEGMGQDRVAQSLLGAAIIMGFIVEGARMAMTQVPPDLACYAFIGNAIAHLFTPGGLTSVYGYLWYIHAVIWAAFLCYLPFSRMFHIVLAPIVLAVNAATKHRHQ